MFCHVRCRFTSSLRRGIALRPQCSTRNPALSEWTPCAKEYRRKSNRLVAFSPSKIGFVIIAVSFCRRLYLKHRGPCCEDGQQILYFSRVVGRVTSTLGIGPPSASELFSCTVCVWWWYFATDRLSTYLGTVGRTCLRLTIYQEVICEGQRHNFMR